MPCWQVTLLFWCLQWLSSPHRFSHSNRKEAPNSIPRWPGRLVTAVQRSRTMPALSSAFVLLCRLWDCRGEYRPIGYDYKLYIVNDKFSRAKTCSRPVILHAIHIMHAPCIMHSPSYIALKSVHPTDNEIIKQQCGLREYTAPGSLGGAARSCWPAHNRYKLLSLYNLA